MILFLVGIYINIRVHTYLHYNELSINERVLIVSQDCLYTHCARCGYTSIHSGVSMWCGDIVTGNNRT